jgi:NAD(P)-dependent dehydrogenase (short-subunit alcohol dehydrogenase family)
MSAIVFDFSQLNVIVTGGTSGIGLATAKSFLAAGARVTVTGQRAAFDEYTDVDLSGFDYRRLQLDNKASIAEFAGSVKSVDILINNAGHIMPDAERGVTSHADQKRAYRRRQHHQYRLDDVLFRQSAPAWLWRSQGRDRAADENPGGGLGEGKYPG